MPQPFAHRQHVELFWGGRRFIRDREISEKLFEVGGVVAQRVFGDVLTPQLVEILSDVHAELRHTRTGIHPAYLTRGGTPRRGGPVYRDVTVVAFHRRAAAEDRK